MRRTGFVVAIALLATAAAIQAPHATAMPPSPAAAVLPSSTAASLEPRAGLPRSHALFSAVGRAEVAALVEAATDAPGPSPQQIDKVVLEPDGTAVVVVDGTTGPVSVQIPADLLDPLLSPVGHRVRDAALDGEPMVSAEPGPVSSLGIASLTAAPAGAPVSTSTAAPAPTAPTPTQTASFVSPDCSTVACVALTFDDGPGPYTAALLDELAAKGAAATFFVVGYNVSKRPDLVQREIAEGHAVGNHSAGHPDLTSLPLDEAAQQVDALSQALVQATGVAPTLVRPPYGATNPDVNAMLADRGYAVVMWSIDTEDWKNRDVALTTQRALTGVAPGSIILMHDIHESTVAAVPGIIDQLRAAGFTLVTVPQLLRSATPGQVYRHG